MQRAWVPASTSRRGQDFSGIGDIGMAGITPVWLNPPGVVCAGGGFETWSPDGAIVFVQPTTCRWISTGSTASSSRA
jgi:hypothetical protein